jgi:hypothetical protein
MPCASVGPTMDAWWSCASTTVSVLHAEICMPSSDAICLAGIGTAYWYAQFHISNRREAPSVMIGTMLIVHIYARQSLCSQELERASRETRSTWHLPAPTTPPPSVKGGARICCTSHSAATRCDDHLHRCVRYAPAGIVEWMARCPPVAGAS